jgi:sortase A
MARNARAGWRRLIGAGLALAGGVLVTFAGVRYAIGAVRADEARSAWEAQQARAAVDRARSLVADRGSAPSVAGAPVARIMIPRIDLDAIVLEGVSDDELNAGPGHFPGSALPGDLGNAVISAHRDRHFSHFDELSVGDTVVTEARGLRNVWVIVSRRVIDKDSRALFRTSDATLTLTTCWPIRYFGPAPDRLIVTAKPVATHAHPQSVALRTD